MFMFKMKSDLLETTLNFKDFQIKHFVLPKIDKKIKISINLQSELSVI